jgi:hypothetical protein
VAGRPGTGPHVPAEHVRRPVDVHALDRARIGVVAVQGGHVDDGVTAGEGLLERHRVQQLDAVVAHLRAALAQLAGDVAPHEAARARDVDLHPAARARRARASASTGQTIR